MLPTNRSLKTPKLIPSLLTIIAFAILLLMNTRLTTASGNDGS
jgi:hypothetical protein